MCMHGLADLSKSKLSGPLDREVAGRFRLATTAGCAKQANVNTWPEEDTPLKDERRVTTTAPANKNEQLTTRASQKKTRRSTMSGVSSRGARRTDGIDSRMSQPISRSPKKTRRWKLSGVSIQTGRLRLRSHRPNH